MANQLFILQQVLCDDICVLLCVYGAVYSLISVSDTYLVSFQVLLPAIAEASGTLKMAAHFFVMVDCMSLSAVTPASGCMATAPAAVCLASGLDIHHCASVSHYSLNDYKQDYICRKYFKYMQM